MVIPADILSWTALWTAVGGAVLAALVLIVLLFVLGRSRRRTRREIEAVRASSQRVEVMVADLTSAFERARDETSRSRQLGEIGSTIDLDEVLARALEAAGALSGVDAAMIVVKKGDDDRPLVATMGLSPEEAAGQPANLPEPRNARAVLTSYRYARPNGAEAGESIRGGLTVPLRTESGEALGSLAVFWRAGGREPGEEEIALLEELARSAAPAIENAKRFKEARQLADLDALTGLHNHRYFHETLAREVARAQRYDRQLALILFDIDDFKGINDRIGHLAGDAVLSEAAERVQSVVRGADIACRVGGDEFAVVLPESTGADAENLYRRLQSALASWRDAAAEDLRLSAGVAELRPDDDAVSFFKRADAALYRAKEAGKGQAYFADRPV